MASVIGSLGILHLLFLVLFFLNKYFKAPIHGKRAVIGSPWQIHFPSLPSSSFLRDSGLPLGKDKIDCKSSVALLIIHHCHCNSNKLALNSCFPLVLSQSRIDRAAEERQKSGRLLDDIWQIEGTFREGDFEDIQRIGCEQCPRLPCLPAVHLYGG